MKRITTVLAVVLATGLLFQFCASSKSKKMAAAPTTYEGHVMPLIQAKCSPCHIAPDGKKKHYSNYDAVKADIDSLIRRVSLQPNEKGFMPFKKTERLPDSLIQVLVKWKADGFPVK